MFDPEKPLYGLSRAMTVQLRIVVATSLILSGCASSPEFAPPSIEERDPAAWEAQQAEEAAKAEAARAEQAAKMDAYHRDLRAYHYAYLQKPEAQLVIDYLCSLPLNSPELFLKIKEHGITPKRSPALDASAERMGFAVVDCEQRAKNQSQQPAE